MRALLLIASLATACGLAPFDDEPGGRDNLPTRAAGPYDKTEIDFDTPADAVALAERILARAHLRAV